MPVTFGAEAWRSWIPLARLRLCGSQERITLDGDDYYLDYLDLLFYHRLLRRLVVIKLKIGDFKAADVGQMKLHLRLLDRQERQKGEEKPIGLILRGQEA